jgi:hypothetical protein
MKLEFFADAFEGSGLLLLYSGGPSEVERLREQVSKLVTPGSSIQVDALDFIDALGSCELIFSTAKRSRGVLASRGAPRFELQLDSSDWERVGDLLEPFCHPEPDAKGARFQYLHEQGGIEVIYSTARQW